MTVLVEIELPVWDAILGIAGVTKMGEVLETMISGGARAYPALSSMRDD